jgi:hypothetical protein
VGAQRRCFALLHDHLRFHRIHPSAVTGARHNPGRDDRKKRAPQAWRLQNQRSVWSPLRPWAFEISCPSWLRTLLRTPSEDVIVPGLAQDPGLSGRRPGSGGYPASEICQENQALRWSDLPGQIPASGSPCVKICPESWVRHPKSDFCAGAACVICMSMSIERHYMHKGMISAKLLQLVIWYTTLVDTIAVGGLTMQSRHDVSVQTSFMNTFTGPVSPTKDGKMPGSWSRHAITSHNFARSGARPSAARRARFARKWRPASDLIIQGPARAAVTDLSPVTSDIDAPPIADLRICRGSSSPCGHRGRRPWHSLSLSVGRNGASSQWSTK